MSFDLAIKVIGIVKKYPIYKQPIDRLKQFIYSGLTSTLGVAQKNCYKEFIALNNISFEIQKGQSVGIIGRNGSGKSTLLQIMCGILNPTAGEIVCNGRIAALLELGSGFNPEFTGRENIYLNASILGLLKNEVDVKLQDILDFADIGDFIDQPVKTYSSGMVVRLAFAVIAHVNADILVIDEALAVGDAVFTQKCMRFLRRFMEKNTVVFVSHDTSSILNLCSTAIWLDGGTMRAIGDVKEVVNAYSSYCAQQVYGEKIRVNTIRPNVKKRETKKIHDIRAEFLVNLENSESWGTGVSEITNVSVANLDGSSQFFGGEEVVIELETCAKQDFSNPIMGFILKDRLGQSLFGENTYSEEGVTKNVSKGQVIKARFKFELPFLPNGEFSLTVATGEGTPDDYIAHHWVHDAAIISVYSTKKRYGLVGIPFQEISLTI